MSARKASLARITNAVGEQNVEMDLLFENKVLGFCTSLAFVGVIIWMTAVATDYWIILVCAPSLLPDQGQHQFRLLWSHSGLWQRCDVFRNGTSDDQQEVHCEFHHTYVQENDVGHDFLRVELAFVTIVILMIFLSAGFSLYSLLHPRYVFKRLAGSLHLMTTVTLVVVIEMVKSEGHLLFHDFSPDMLQKSRMFYGYSYLLAWVVFILFLFAGIAFLSLSKKRKYLKHDFSATLK